ncbi:hypothetical protein ACFYQ5_17415 [Streptomyces sp. NPDC005794]
MDCTPQQVRTGQLDGVRGDVIYDLGQADRPPPRLAAAACSWT